MVFRARVDELFTGAHAKTESFQIFIGLRFLCYNPQKTDIQRWKSPSNSIFVFRSKGCGRAKTQKISPFMKNLFPCKKLQYSDEKSFLSFPSRTIILGRVSVVVIVIIVDSLSSLLPLRHLCHRHCCLNHF